MPGYVKLRLIRGRPYTHDQVSNKTCSFHHVFSDNVSFPVCLSHTHTYCVGYTTDSVGAEEQNRRETLWCAGPGGAVERCRARFAETVGRGVAVCRRSGTVFGARRSRDGATGTTAHAYGIAIARAEDRKREIGGTPF